jgi:hypothetical protein
MPHPRQLIRHAAAAQLLGKTEAANRVFRTRVVAYKRVELPALSVHTPDEQIDSPEDSAPVEYSRVTQLVVEGFVEGGNGNVDDALDELAWQAEGALHADDTLAGTASKLRLASTDTEVIEDGARLIGVVRLVFDVEYFTYMTDGPELPDFDSAGVRYNLTGAVHPDNEARDELALPKP